MKWLLAVGLPLIVFVVFWLTPAHRVLIAPTSERVVCDVSHVPALEGRGAGEWLWQCHPVRGGK